MGQQIAGAVLLLWIVLVVAVVIGMVAITLIGARGLCDVAT